MITTMCLDLIVGAGGKRLPTTSSLTSIALSIEEEESPIKRIEQTVVESPVVVLSRRGCCLCHVMKKLLVSVGVHPVVIELEDKDVGIISSSSLSPPVVFIGGELVGGLESLMGLHLSGELVLRLVEVQAL